VTKSFRTRLVMTVSAFALLAAGAVLTAQAFAARPAAAPATDGAGVAAPTDAAAVTMTDWNETRLRGSVIRP
jgi:hypothetical protein